MANIILDSHDLLGKLTIIKNYLSVAGEKINPEIKKLIEVAAQTNQELIDLVSRKAKHG